MMHKDKMNALFYEHANSLFTIYNHLLHNKRNFRLHEWGPSKLINALLNCGRIKSLTSLLPTVYKDLNRTRDLEEALCCGA